MTLKEKLVARLQAFLGISLLKHELIAAKLRIKALEKRLADETDIHVDVDYGGCSVFVAGRHKKQDYVQLFRIQTEDFSYIVETLRNMQRHVGHLKFVDAPIHIAGTIKREVER